MQDKSFYGKNGMVWFTGIVENRLDPLLSNRVQVRFHGYHTADLTKVLTLNLAWAYVGDPTTSAAVSGIGEGPCGLVEGSLVYGFFLDGYDCQMPLITGSIKGIPLYAPNKQSGFNDPRIDFATVPVPPDATNFTGFPYLLDEPDVNRLARNESIASTIVPSKTTNLDTTQTAQHTSTDDPSDKAIAAVTVSQPKSSYAAVYPYNKVRATESGHIQEFDDTPGAERINTYHKSGTYTEVGPDGQITSVCRDNIYSVTGGNVVEHVVGTKDIIVDGNATIKVNQLILEVADGNYYINVTNGSANLYINGNLNMVVTGNINRTIEGNLTDVVYGTYTMSAGTAMITADDGVVNVGNVGLTTHIHPTPDGPSSPPTPGT